MKRIALIFSPNFDLLARGELTDNDLTVGGAARRACAESSLFRSYHYGQDFVLLPQLSSLICLDNKSPAAQIYIVSFFHPECSICRRRHGSEIEHACE